VGSGVRGGLAEGGTAQADGVNRPVYFRTTFGAFLLVLISLTAAIWLTRRCATSI